MAIKSNLLKSMLMLKNNVEYNKRYNSLAERYNKLKEEEAVVFKRGTKITIE